MRQRLRAASNEALPSLLLPYSLDKSNDIQSHHYYRASSMISNLPVGAYSKSLSTHCPRRIASTFPLWRRCRAHRSRIERILLMDGTGLLQALFVFLIILIISILSRNGHKCIMHSQVIRQSHRYLPVRSRRQAGSAKGTQICC